MGNHIYDYHAAAMIGMPQFTEHPETLKYRLLPLPHRTLANFVTADHAVNLFQEAVVKLANLDVFIETALLGVIENPSGDTFFNDHCPRAVFVLVYLRPRFALHLKKRSDDRGPAEMGDVREVKHVMKAVVVWLIAVIGQAISDKDAVAPLHNMTGFNPTPFYELDAKLSRQLFMGVELLIKGTDVLRGKTRPTAKNFDQIIAGHILKFQVK